MDIHFRCPVCAAEAEAPDSSAGRPVHCARCGELVRVPRLARGTVECGQPGSRAEAPKELEPAGPSIAQSGADAQSGGRDGIVGAFLIGAIVSGVIAGLLVLEALIRAFNPKLAAPDGLIGWIQLWGVASLLCLGAARWAARAMARRAKREEQAAEALRQAKRTADLLEQLAKSQQKREAHDEVSQRARS